MIIKRQNLEVDLESTIRSVLDPGESLQMVALNFGFGVQGSIDNASRSAAFHLALTDRNLRKLRIDIPRSRKKLPTVLESTTMPLNTITGVRVRRTPRKWTGIAASITVWVSWHGGRAEEWTSCWDDAEPFVAALEASLARRTVATATGGVADEISKLGELAGRGVITHEEFERGKELFLGRAPEEAADKIGLLRELHSLHERGVLSESEFNMKKWEILAS